MPRGSQTRLQALANAAPLTGFFNEKSAVNMMVLPITFVL